MRLSRIPSIEIKTPGQFALMREAGLVVARMLHAAAAAAEPGISTAELDAIAEREMRAAGAQSSFKGYHGYPATICTSVNDQIVHGIPDPDVRLAAGDVLSIDAGAIVGGWHGDAAVTVPVGAVPEQVTALLAACELAMWHGLAAAVAGQHLTDISPCRRDQRAGQRRIRDRPRVHRALHRLGHAHGSGGAELRPARTRPGARRGDGAGHRADARPRRAAHQAAR